MLPKKFVEVAGNEDSSDTLTHPHSTNDWGTCFDDQTFCIFYIGWIDG